MTNTPPPFLFKEVMRVILQYEGGYVCHKDDPGGETNFGITKKSYPELDIKNLTPAIAMSIYRKDYWEPALVECVPPMLCLAYMDCAVNQGVPTAIRLLQRSANATVDGVIGPQTLECIDKMRQQDLLNNFLTFRVLHYVELSGFPTFGKGWIKRIMDIAAISNAKG